MARGNVVTAVMVTIMIGAVAWCWTALANPVVNVPKYAPPKPNAFDDYQKAIALFHDDPAIGPGRKMPHQGDPGYSTAFVQGVSAAHQAEIVAANKAALAEVRLGLTRQYLSPPIRSIDDTAPYYRGYRYLSYLLHFEGQVAAGHGDWNQDMEDSVESVAMGEQIPRGGDISAFRARDIVSGIGRQNAWVILNHLNEEQCRKYALKLQAVEQTRVLSSEIWQQEEWEGESVLSKAMAQTNFADLLNGPSFPATYFLARPKWHTIYCYKSAMEDAVKASGKPYQVDKTFCLPEPKNDILNEIVLPIYGKQPFKAAQDETYNQLLMTMLALRAYEIDHAGVYPDRLDQLIPKYLSRVPLDPFASDLGPLKYRRIGKSYLLYSVGPDGVDDGGKPFLNTKCKKVDARSYLWVDTKGDIVAGVNMD